MTRVRIGIVSWNTAALLDRCLATIPSAVDGLDVEVVVVDNASGDDSIEVARRHPGVQVIANAENVGYARAMNQALAETDAPVLIALNPDTECPPHSLARLVRLLEAHPEVGVVAPRLIGTDRKLQHSVYRFPSPAVAAAVGILPGPLHGGPVGRHFWLEGHAPHDQAGRVDWAIGAVHVIRASALGGQPPYRERWFMYVEDLDLCWRLTRAGHRTWFAADVDIVHVGNAAGAQAWGEGRTARWLDATYDWYAVEKGEWAARWWGAINLLGVALKLVGARVGLAARLPHADRRTWWFNQLRGWLPIHLAKVVHGPYSGGSSGSRPIG